MYALWKALLAEVDDSHSVIQFNPWEHQRHQIYITKEDVLHKQYNTCCCKFIACLMTPSIFYS